VSHGPGLHGFIASDLHLSEAVPRDPRRPLWRRYRHRDLFIDEPFAAFLAWARRESGERAELLLNGDIFDFDSVLAVPESPPFPVSWLERRRGLFAEEPKSVFKLERILADHPVWRDALRAFLAAGNEVVFVLGNHDLELHWPAVQGALRAALDPAGTAAGRLRFCEFFAVSGGDTLITHGNQFDPYSLCADPARPLVRGRGGLRVRMPFANWGLRLMGNGMGLFNPHADSSFLLTPWGYAKFFVQRALRVEPLLPWTWLWGAAATFVMAMREGLRPAVGEARFLEVRVEDMARRAGTQPAVVRTLAALSAHPAAFSPWRLARELWLDRALLLAGVVWASLHVGDLLGWAAGASPAWHLLAFAVLMIPFAIYARGVRSEADRVEHLTRKRAPEAARAAGVARVVLGHTHVAYHVESDGIELLNTGTWSPAFHDVECTRPYGRKCFAWLAPVAGGSREARLLEWRDDGPRAIPAAELAPRGMLSHLEPAATPRPEPGAA
jgi:UDP-2,3-diacylglucosamine pyrophosphatase LpxH